MVVLYTSLLLVLGTAGFLIRRRALSLERRYSALLKQTNTLLREPLPREGNSARTDPYLTAKRNYQLGVLAEKKEGLEGKHYAWQARADRVGRWIKNLRAWKGRRLPYVFGAFDVFTALCVLEYVGLGDRLSPHHLVQVVRTWLSI
jgi:hypothetical protein